eukprot:TRINITY_DN13504_c0_g1_i2.p1 TRINITY_DN13504_c0_g1~~TRINITY_DN13504_c0_g1_i2.p1  ORF type:complete len:127 (-),score=33.29 TRINITY_DN13504_c0_g1_i2:322-702(-)
MGTCGSTTQPPAAEPSDDPKDYWNVLSGKKSTWTKEEEDVFDLTERLFRPKEPRTEHGDTNQFQFQLMEKDDETGEWDSFVRVENLTTAGNHSTMFWRVRIISRDGNLEILEHLEYDPSMKGKFAR